MKITAKKPLNTQTEIQGGKTDGIPSGKTDGIFKENTNQAKARKILELGYSKRSLSTLERLPVAELDFILREKRDPEKNEISKATIESSKEIIKGFVSTCEALKQTRTKEPLNAGIRGLVESQNNALSEYVGVNAGGRAGIIILGIASFLLVVDSIVGFDKVRELFSKKKPKPKEDADSKEDKK